MEAPSNQLIVCMASSGYLTKETSEACIESLVKQCALPDTKKGPSAATNAADSPANDLLENKFRGHVSSLALRRVCETGLLLLAGTVPAAEILVCKCITEILKHKISSGEKVSVDYTTSPSIPQPEELLARLLLLLQFPLDSELASTVLIILDYLGPIFPTAVVLLWEVEIPKMKAYVSDINVASWQQTTWEDMIMHLLSDLLGVVHDPEWIMSFGNALATHYSLYRGNQQIALLHRFGK